MKKLLFIAWDGSTPHYMQGLFLPIMAGLQAEGYSVSIMQFSAIEEESVKGLKEQAAAQQVDYQHIRVDRKSIGFFKALMAGSKRIKRYVKANPDCILMPRSLMPCAMLKLAGLGKETIAYDADGLKLEERLDFAGWHKGSLSYKIFRMLEKWSYRKADVILTRSYEAKKVMLHDYPLLQEKPVCKVINGKDTSVFKPLSIDGRTSGRLKLGISDSDILAIYCGTIAPQYCLDQMMIWFEWLKEAQPNAKFMILTGDTEKVKQHAIFQKLSNAIVLNTVPASAVPAWLGLADVAFAFRRSSHSMKGVAPIKIGEYLLCGLPVLASKGIGDTEADLAPLIQSYVLNEQEEPSLRSAFEGFLKDSEAGQMVPLKESIERGVECYSLEAAVDSYLEALRQIKFD